VLWPPCHGFYLGLINSITLWCVQHVAVAGLVDVIHLLLYPTRNPEGF